MRSGFIVSLIATLLFTGGYFYYVAEAVCPAPLAYSIGQLDEEFGLSFDEAKLAIAEAESVWEDATGQNLFTYETDAPFTINFIYDERQAVADAEDTFKAQLDQTQSASDAINEAYETLVTEYNKLQIEYSKQAKRYETNLAAYNAQVGSLNAQGGADESEYAVLQERKEELDAERVQLNARSEELNALVVEINDISERGNKIVETYNRGVEEYNDTFGEKREFTQGTYSTDGRIDIFAFSDSQELRIVLAHELGHALSLDHVANESSVMYFLIGDQPEELVVSEEDIAEFVRVCSNRSVWDTIQLSINNFIL